jgi:hypothetical protein
MFLSTPHTRLQLILLFHLLPSYLRPLFSNLSLFAIQVLLFGILILLLFLCLSFDFDFDFTSASLCCFTGKRAISEVFWSNMPGSGFDFEHGIGILQIFYIWF